MKKNFDFENESFIGFLQELLKSQLYEKNDDYDEIFKGIVQFTIDNGWNSLSDRQKEVIRIRIEQICPDSCTHCLASIPWCEMLFAMEHDDMCTHCVKLQEDLKKE